MLARSMDSVTVLRVLVRVSRDGKAKTAATFTAPTSTTVPVMEHAWGQINVAVELAGRHETYNWYFYLKLFAVSRVAPVRRPTAICTRLVTPAVDSRAVVGAIVKPPAFRV